MVCQIKIRGACAAVNGPESVALGDLDGDGNPDLAVANAGSDVVSVLLGNGDGNPDLAVANQNSDDISILLGGGDGTFAAQQRFAVGDVPVSVAIGDLDGDGNLDLAVTNPGNSFTSPPLLGNVSVLLGNGDGTFAAQQRFAAGGRLPLSVAIGNLDDDENLDLAVANLYSTDVSVLLGRGDGTFAAQRRFAAGDGPRSVAIGDLNGDGNPDLAVANFNSNNVSVLLNRRIP